jgi:hypothetical protein
MRITLDEVHSTAQSSIFVQLGFETGGPRLLWLSVEPASRALPAALLAQAGRRD